MSKNKNDYNILIPGENGWDLWSCSPSGIKLLRRTEETLALNIEKFPHNKPVVMAFPVKELTALSLWAPKDEAEATTDLISFQVEKMGLAQGEDKGTLNQHTHVQDSSDGEQSLYSIDVLRAPKEGSLPEKSPRSFNVSPRCYPLPHDSITLWKEFGKWVMALSNKEGKLVHYQSFTESQLGAHIIEDIKFTIGQLMIQKVIEKRPENYLIWTEEEGIYPEGFDTLEKVFSNQLKVETKPSPTLPPAGKLLPADTRAERLEAKRKKRQNALFTLAALLLLGLLGYAGYALWNLEKRAQTAKAEEESLRAENQALLDHNSKWEELSPLVDSENDPISLLLKSTKAIPSPEIRLERAEFTHQITENEKGKELSITIIGNADDLTLANKYGENLERSNDLSNFKWTNQAPVQTPNGGWKFTYRADQK